MRATITTRRLPPTSARPGARSTKPRVRTRSTRTNPTRRRTDRCSRCHNGILVPAGMPPPSVGASPVYKLCSVCLCRGLTLSNIRLFRCKSCFAGSSPQPPASAASAEHPSYGRGQIHALDAGVVTSGIRRCSGGVAVAHSGGRKRRPGLWDGRIQPSGPGDGGVGLMHLVQRACLPTHFGRIRPIEWSASSHGTVDTSNSYRDAVDASKWTRWIIMCLGCHDILDMAAAEPGGP
jgi:hypothetical protein